MKKFLTVSFVVVGVLASTVSASAMGFSATLSSPDPSLVKKFGDAQKTEKNPYLLAYWRTSSAGQSFSMRVYATDGTGKIKGQNVVYYLSSSSVSLSTSEHYSLQMFGGVEAKSFTGTFKTTTVGGTWELATTTLKKADASEK